MNPARRSCWALGQCAKRASKSRARSPSGASLPLRAGRAGRARRAPPARAADADFELPRLRAHRGGGRGAGARAAARKPVDAHEDPRRSARHRRTRRHAGAVRGRGGDCRRRPDAATDGGMAAATWRGRSAGAAAQCAEPDARLSSTGPTRPCAAPRWRCRRACCGTCPPRPCISASCPKVAPAHGPRGADAPAARRALRSAAAARPRDAHRTRHRRDGHRDHAQSVRGHRADAGARHHRHHAGRHAPIAACWPRSPAGRCSSSTGRRKRARARTRRIENAA